MNALILAAGYATRLYPLTLKKAKPLLLVGAKPIIEWVVDNLSGVPDLETIYVVTNDKFAADFQAWSEHYRSQHPEFKFKIINDGSTSDEDKLGAIGDINFVISRQNLSQSSLLIVAGDNLLTESLTDFVACARRSDATVAVYDVGDAEAIKKYGNISVDADGIITRRGLLLFARSSLSFNDVSGCGQQSGSAGPFCAMALHAQTGKNVSNQREMARYWKQASFGERRSDSRQTQRRAIMTN